MLPHVKASGVNKSTKHRRLLNTSLRTGLRFVSHSTQKNHFTDILHSQSVSKIILKKLNRTQQKQTCSSKSKNTATQNVNNSFAGKYKQINKESK